MRDAMVHPECGPITLVEMEDRDCTTWVYSEWCRDFNGKAVGCLHGLQPPRPVGPTQGSGRRWSDILAELEAEPSIVKGGGANKPRPVVVPAASEGSGSSASGLCPICRMFNCACGLSTSRSRADRDRGASCSAGTGVTTSAPRSSEAPPMPKRTPPPPPWKAGSPAAAKAVAVAKAKAASALAGMTPLVSLRTQGAGSVPQAGWGKGGA